MYGQGHGAELYRTMKYLPLKSCSFHLDLPGLLFALAYHRGRFTPELYDIFSTRTSEQPTFIQTYAHMHRKPVFVSDMADPTSPMGSQKWADLLQLTCIDSGLVGRYLPYALRRGTLLMFKMRRASAETKMECSKHSRQHNLLFNPNKPRVVAYVTNLAGAALSSEHKNVPIHELGRFQQITLMPLVNHQPKTPCPQPVQVHNKTRNMIETTSMT
jgi:hypothetical protein